MSMLLKVGNRLRNNNHKESPTLNQVKITACFYIHFREETSEQGMHSKVNVNSSLGPAGSSIGMAQHGVLVGHPG